MKYSGLEKLKDVIAKAKDFQSAFEYFLDNFGEDEKFLDNGRRTRNPLLEATLLEIAKQHFGAGAAIGNLLLISVPGTSFIHGRFATAGRTGSVLYFDDVQIGLMCILPARRGEDTRFNRFSCRRLPPEAVGTEN